MTCDAEVCTVRLNSLFFLLQKEDASIASVKKALKVLDGYLLEHTFLVGESVTLADIVGACNIYLGMTMVCNNIILHVYSKFCP